MSLNSIIKLRSIFSHFQWIPPSVKRDQVSFEKFFKQKLINYLPAEKLGRKTACDGIFKEANYDLRKFTR
uniref:Uncharacterized protein n=1 Tax=Romanomermis culicivorax TaxID=13658 RepID=A0A915L6G5_ROMCU